MKNIITNIILFTITFCAANTFAQREWVQQNSGTTSNLYAVDFVNENTGFAAGGVLLKTTDGGTSRIVLPLSGSFRDIDFIDEYIGYIANGSEILKTTDGGNNWSTTDSVQITQIFALSFVDDQNGIAVVGQSIVRTSDGGESWIPQPSFGQDWFGAFFNYDIAIAVGHNGTIARSTNYGLNWEFIDLDQDDFQGVHLFNESIGAAVGDGEIMQTTDGGSTWIDRGFPEDIFGIYCANETDYIGVGIDGRILSTTDGLLNWGYENSGTTEHLWGVQMIGSGKWIIVGNSGTILKSEPTPITVTSPNGGEAWQGGTVQTISWLDNLSENVRIDLYKGGHFDFTITFSTSSDGIYNWTIPYSTRSGMDYKIKITSVNNSSITDLSDNEFTISETAGQVFTEQINLPGSYGSVDWGDYDNDGDLDILAGGTIFNNEGQDVFTAQVTLFSGYTFQSTWADYDNDNDLDVLILRNYVPEIYRNDGNNNFVLQNQLGLSGAGYGAADWGDYDNDGDLDLLLIGEISDDIFVNRIYRNEGNGSFVDIQMNFPVVFFQGSAHWGDYDNDMDLDFILTGWIYTGSGQSNALIYKNEGGEIFQPQYQFNLSEVGEGSSAWGDYNGDGYLDIVLTGLWYTGVNDDAIHRTDLFLNVDGTNFTEQTQDSLIGVEHSSSIWGDYDNDGDLDLLVSGTRTPEPVASILYRNDGDIFIEMVGENINPSTGYADNLSFADYDKDGDLDLLIASDGIIYKNNSNILNTKPTTPTNLISTVNNNEITISWDKSTDNETLQDGLTYNIVIGTNPNSVDIVSPMADQSTGFRRIVDLGNTNHNNRWTIKDLAPGTYYWSVQAIDNAFSGSDFASQETFVITDNNNDLVAYYPFNGNTNDESGKDHHGSIIGNPSFIQDRHGNPNSALSFDGNDDWIEVSSSSLFPSDAITICYWINRDGNDITSNQNYISKELSFQSYILDYSDGENIFESGYWLGSPGVWTGYHTNYKVIMLNEWVFYAFTYENNTQTAKSYVNGVLDSTVVETDPNYYLRPSNQKMFIGRNGSANVYHIKGFLDDVRIYDYALSEEEVSELYDIDTGGNPITVTSPNGGETWSSGHSQTITWTDNISENVKIELYWEGIFDSEITSSTTSSGSYSWDIPAGMSSGSTYKIKITSTYNSSIFDFSDANFNMDVGLPVELTVFEATTSQGRVSLNWQTATEVNNYGFDIESHVNDDAWTTIGFVNGSGNSNSPKQYSFIDSNPSGGSKFFYRLKQIDNDGTYEYSDEVEVEIIPDEFVLYQNYPNPFNPVTFIKYEIPELSLVTLKVFDVLGSEVAILVNEEKPIGNYEIEFNGTELPSGIYFYRLQAGTFIETKKMVLMK